jgi:uncharacterized repeat protein (TIGR03809 family)
MSERQQSPYESVSRRWLTLVERRQQHVLELSDTGRWRHYFTEAEFIEEMRRILDLRTRWAELAGVVADAAEDATDSTSLDDANKARAASVPAPVAPAIASSDFADALTRSLGRPLNESLAESLSQSLAQSLSQSFSQTLSGALAQSLSQSFLPPPSAPPSRAKSLPNVPWPG